MVAFFFGVYAIAAAALFATLIRIAPLMPADTSRLDAVDGRG